MDLREDNTFQKFKKSLNINLSVVEYHLNSKKILMQKG